MEYILDQYINFQLWSHVVSISHFVHAGNLGVFVKYLI